ncbi:hypothetical protein AAFO92_15990 [Roseovarius sp. CAU 1744]|uniref:hypothetical protein n=1 Tax=Roseovarius sp. CAU 1744 TaxID=3140368 RepID=UPI00325AB272
MHPKKTIDFKRGLKTLATEQGWLVDIVSEDRKPTERLVIYYKEGHEPVRISSFVLKQDEKEINPGIARRIVRHIRMLMDEDNAAPICLLDERRAILVTWINNFFS